MGLLSKIFGVDPDFLAGRTIDAQSESGGSIPEGADFRTKVESVLDQVRPGLHADGGDVELVDVIGHSIRVKLVGACEGCASSSITLRHGIEKKLRDQIPEFEDLIPF
jgi:Fe-S cluster biogenesis protein NfuA